MSARPTGQALLDALESGEVRVAEPHGDDWHVHAWVKEEILALFRTSDVVALGEDRALWPFVDKEAFPVRSFDGSEGVRLVPGGSAVRRGAYVGAGTVLMPPCYVNVGAHVGAGSMIDSHALVGSCAQVGARVHVSAGAQIGGVLEPVGSQPVIVEDDVLVGGQCGLYEGVRVRERAVLASGVVLTATTRVYDLTEERELERPLVIPRGAVVVPGSRPAGGAYAEREGLSMSCALIVKVRDAATDDRTALEEALR